MKVNLLSVAAVFLGALLALQGVLNSLLGRTLEHPLQATFVNFLVGGFVVAFILLVMGIGFPDGANLKKPDWYLYSGGLLGAIFVTGILLLVPRIGVAGVVLAAFVGQIVASLAFDHAGLFGLPKIPLDSKRMLGAALMLAGLYIVQYQKDA